MFSLGPGTYDEGQIIKRRIDDRSLSFRSMAPRFAPNCPGANVYNYPSSYVNPGPGDYEISQLKGRSQVAKKYRNQGRIETKSMPSIPCSLIE